MLTHADKFTCFCHCTCHTPSFYYSVSVECEKCWLFTHSSLQKDQSLQLQSLVAKNINTAGERET